MGQNQHKTNYHCEQENQTNSSHPQ